MSEIPSMELSAGVQVDPRIEAVKGLTQLGSGSRSPIAIMGVAFDNVTTAEVIERIDQMVESGQPHYLVTANVDFLVQARGDVELHRILTEAHLVLCDGTPLVWASRWLGNPLPERVAGADVVPLLIQVAAQKGYRLFFLGSTPESASQAMARLTAQFPSLEIAGYYSPPFGKLIEMDHEEVRRRIREARPDILFVAFGCPKQEKWMWMHYRSLGVPVSIGVGATVDFLAGQVKRAPVWMRRTGTEWIFRLLQEPRRLFKRYLKDLWVFARALLPQLWYLQLRRSFQEADRSQIDGILGWDWNAPGDQQAVGPSPKTEMEYNQVEAPACLDRVELGKSPHSIIDILQDGCSCLLNLKRVEFIDSTGVGMLLTLQKKLRENGHFLVLLSPSRMVLRALSVMMLQDFFLTASDLGSAERLLEKVSNERLDVPEDSTALDAVDWRGEVTAANVARVWENTLRQLAKIPEGADWLIDLSRVRFIDSSGLGLMIRAKKLAQERQRRITFRGMQPAVRNVVRLAQLEKILLG